MKIAYFLALSVGLSQCLPLAVQAAENAQSDKADWIKQSLACLDNDKSKAPKAMNQNRGSKLYLSQLQAQKPLNNMGNARLRPFVPNRYLPREQDLKLASESEHFDSSYIQGQISNEDVGKSVNKSNYSPDLVQALQAIIKSQNGQKAQSKANSIAHKANSLKTNFIEPPEFRAKIMPESLMKASIEPNSPSQFVGFNWHELSKRVPIVQPPILSPEEMAQLDNTVDANMPPGANEFVPTANNFLPFNAMQNLNDSRKFNRKPTIAARFGSWHSKDSLPAAGFQSYAHNYSAGPKKYLSHVPQNYSSYKSQVKPQYKASNIKPKALPKSVAYNKEIASNKPLTVAVYPPYTGQSSVYLF
jgi:hypothetical protein